MYGLIQSEKTKIDIGSSIVNMYECTGKVHSILNFVKENISLLSDFEQDIITKNRQILNKEEKTPSFLNKCYTRTKDLKISNNSFAIKRSGARSAYWEEKKIKFKGCRPIINKSSTFPLETLEFGKKTILYKDIPFGVLSKEAVLREILAFCFFNELNIKTAHTPVCIYEYVNKGKSLGYCLILSSIGELRIEQYIEYPDISLKELIEIKSKNKKNKNIFIGKELNLRKINVLWYVEEKAKILSKMHFNGGFRGILNSNIGNDIIIKSKNSNNLYICDFDTFKVIQIPNNPDLEFLNSFVLNCLIEVLKGSISILDYYNFPENFSNQEINKILFNKYSSISSLWKSYERIFLLKAKELNWDMDLLSKAYNYAFKTDALLNVISLVIPNSRSIKEILENRQIYYSHN